MIQGTRPSRARYRPTPRRDRNRPGDTQPHTHRGRYRTPTAAPTSSRQDNDLDHTSAGVVKVHSSGNPDHDQEWYPVACPIASSPTAHADTPSVVPHVTAWLRRLRYCAAPDVVACREHPVRTTWRAYSNRADLREQLQQATVILSKTAQQDDGPDSSEDGAVGSATR